MAPDIFAAIHARRPEEERQRGIVAQQFPVVLGPGAAMGPGAHGDMRHICSTVIVSDDAPVAASSDVRPTLLAGVFPLAERCALMVVTARSLV